MLARKRISTSACTGGWLISRHGSGAIRSGALVGLWSRAEHLSRILSPGWRQKSDGNAQARLSLRAPPLIRRSPICWTSSTAGQSHDRRPDDILGGNPRGLRLPPQDVPQGLYHWTGTVESLVRRHVDDEPR